MARNIFIFHGTGGNPKGNWFPWLKEELEKRGHKVFIPRFPDPRENHPLPDWLNVLKDYEQYINEDSILIGHSLGGLFLLRVLERLTHPVYAAFFVSPPVGIKPIRYFASDEMFSGFVFDWGNIKNKAKHFTVYHSDNDPYISMGNGQEVAKRLGVNFTFIPSSGHFNTEAGFTKFDKLLADINAIS